jgi:hypothetical protein
MCMLWIAMLNTGQVVCVYKGMNICWVELAALWNCLLQDHYQPLHASATDFSVIKPRSLLVLMIGMCALLRTLIGNASVLGRKLFYILHITCASYIYARSDNLRDLMKLRSEWIYFQPNLNHRVIIHFKCKMTRDKNTKKTSLSLSIWKIYG